MRDILYDFDSRMQEKPATYRSLLLQYIQMKKKSLRGQTIKLTRCIEFYRPFCYFRTMIVDEWKVMVSSFGMDIVRLFSLKM